MSACNSSPVPRASIVCGWKVSAAAAAVVVGLLLRLVVVVCESCPDVGVSLSLSRVRLRACVRWAIVSTRAAIVPWASLTSAADECGDWFIRGGDERLRSDVSICWGLRGVEKAPVDCRCRASKMSCSSFGRRGGAGPVLNSEAELSKELEGGEEGFLDALLRRGVALSWRRPYSGVELLLWPWPFAFCRGMMNAWWRRDAEKRCARGAGQRSRGDMAAAGCIVG